MQNETMPRWLWTTVVWGATGLLGLLTLWLWAWIAWQAGWRPGPVPTQLAGVATLIGYPTFPPAWTPTYTPGPSPTRTSTPRPSPTSTPSPTATATPTATRTRKPWPTYSGMATAIFVPAPTGTLPTNSGILNLELTQHIYRLGRAMGVQTGRLSLMGDCEVEPLDRIKPESGAPFALAGSYNRLPTAPAYILGAPARTLLDPTFANPQFGCGFGESPLACEVRLWQPGYAVVAVSVFVEPTLEADLKNIVAYLAQRGIVPIVRARQVRSDMDGTCAGESCATWANQIMARVVYQYGGILWNPESPYTCWDADGIHLMAGICKDEYTVNFVSLLQQVVPLVEAPVN